jgi:decaprenylphospho-beta-D-ribofuranose 2-oxidase
VSRLDRGPAPPRLLTGWGGTAATAARTLAPCSVVELTTTLATTGERVIARGLGRCYGDAAQCAGGLVLTTDRLTGLQLDQAGLAIAEAGVSFRQLLAAGLPLGWFPPVMPGTAQVTMAGAAAGDVHGKNHHVDGSFGRHVVWLDLAGADGRLQRLTPADPGFWATVGGLGLTGVIARVAVQLRRVSSSRLAVATEPAADLAELLAVLRSRDARHRYTVAWLDGLATGRRLGRGVVTGGDHASAETVARQRPGDPLRYRASWPLAVPRLPVSPLTPVTGRAFNEAWFRLTGRPASGRLQSVPEFFHPLDRLRRWSRLYGRHGLIQYQLVVPDRREDLLETALTRLQDAGVPAYLAVLKRFGAASPAPLSFPRPGWTLALDLPAAAGRRLAAVLDTLDADVAATGGAVYLVKDSRLRPELVPVMYPELAQWRQARDRLDPGRRFGSDLSRRLAL